MAKTLAAFGAALRSEIDLGQLNDRLLATVEETMRPTHVLLWLRASHANRQAPGAEHGAR